MWVAAAINIKNFKLSHHEIRLAKYSIIVFSFSFQIPVQS
jgi:hypothetical protein